MLEFLLLLLKPFPVLEPDWSGCWLVGLELELFPEFDPDWSGCWLDEVEPDSGLVTLFELRWSVPTMGSS